MLGGVSGLAFAIGVYLPLATMAPIYLGAAASRAIGDRRAAARDAKATRAVLAASGLVAGEGLAGVVVAGPGGMPASRRARTFAAHSGSRGELVALGLIAASLGFLWLSRCRE